MAHKEEFMSLQHLLHFPKAFPQDACRYEQKYICSLAELAQLEIRLGALMQLYVVYMFIESVTARTGRKFRIGVFSVLVLLSALCEIPGVLPLPIRFYWPIARFWEFGLGVLLFDVGVKPPDRSLHVPGIASAGKASLSIYAWHYVLLAFLRYVISPEMNLVVFLGVAAALTVLSLFTYRLVEMSKAKWLTDGKLFMMSVLPPFALVLAAAFYVWSSSGIVHDVPELDVTVANRERGLHNKYNDRIMEYRGDFADAGGRVKVLIVGNSFARDFANVMLESCVSNIVSISYCRQGDSVADDINGRDDKADVIFLAGIYEEKLNPRLLAFYKGDITAGSTKTYLVGSKYFGESNGAIYNRRFFDGYYDQQIKVPESIAVRNKVQAEQFGPWFVDMLKVAARDDGCVAVFTDDHKLISQDCKHLTRAGAQYYARRLDIRSLLENVCKGKIEALEAR